MIKVIHFDFIPRVYGGAQHKLEKYFNQNIGNKIDYEYFILKGEGFKPNRKRLEEILPEKDVLLIHPGIKGQVRVNKYPELFPNLKIAYLIHDDSAYKEVRKEIAVFGYENYEEITKFILNSNRKSAKRIK